MTLQELDALPDMTPKFAQYVLDGGTRVPYLVPPLKVLYERPGEDGRFIDHEGSWWHVGWLGGKRVKVKENFL